MKDRFGFDAGTRKLEEALAFAARHGFRFVDFNADLGPNRLDRWDEGRVQQVWEMCRQTGISIGVHTSSAVNMAEVAPYVAQAVDRYLEENIRLAGRLGARWVVVHGGYHFSSDVERRKEAALQRLQRALEWAEEVGVPLWLENHNIEPQDAEVHYMPHTIQECRWFFDRLKSPRLAWAFNMAHANLEPEGIEGFLQAFGVQNIGQVRVNDNRGFKEEHLVPGQGTIDFRAFFRRMAELGYAGPYTFAFGNDQEKVLALAEFLSYA